MIKKKKQFGRHSIYWKTTKRRRNARVTADLNPRIPKLQATRAEIVFVYEPTRQLWVSMGNNSYGIWLGNDRTPYQRIIIGIIKTYPWNISHLLFGLYKPTQINFIEWLVKKWIRRACIFRSKILLVRRLLRKMDDNRFDQIRMRSENSCKSFLHYANFLRLLETQFVSGANERN